MAPEVLKGEKSDMSADIWSLGVLLYAMICDEPPYNGIDEDELIASHAQHPVRFDHENWSMTSQSLISLIG